MSSSSGAGGAHRPPINDASTYHHIPTHTPPSTHQADDVGAAHGPQPGTHAGTASRSQHVQHAPQDGVEQTQDFGINPSRDPKGAVPSSLQPLQQPFHDAGIPFPYNPNTTPVLEKQIAHSPDFARSVAAGTEAIQSLSAGSLNAFNNSVLDFKGHNPNANIAEYVMLVLRQCVTESYEDKKVFLNKVTFLNDLNAKYSIELEKIEAMSSQLSVKEVDQNQKYPEMCTISSDARVMVYDANFAGADGKPAAHQLPDVPSNYSAITRQNLSDMTKHIERENEAIRNSRQTATQNFQNFDQKTNQYMNALTQVLKNSYNIIMGIERNIL